MGYIGAKPTAIPLSSADLEDNIITQAKMADDAIGLAEMVGGTDGNLITYDASGNPAVVASGTSGHYLKSQGADTVPVFAAVAAGDNTPSWSVLPSGNFTNGGAYTHTLMPCATEVWDTDSAFTNTAGNYKFTCPVGEAGKYALFGGGNIGGMSDGADSHMYFYKNGSNTSKGQLRSFAGAGAVGIYTTSSCIVDLAEGDYVQLYVTVSIAGGSLTDWQGASCYFMGFKLSGV